MEYYTYTIGDKKYIQRPLVNGQIRQLMKLIKGIVLPKDFDPVVLMTAFGDQLSAALAIVLCEADAIEGKSRQEIGNYLSARDLAALEKEIDWNIDPETTARIIDDFFDCNPIASLLEKFAAIGEKVLSLKKEKTSSTQSASSSPEGISQKETLSSGNIPSPSASRT